MRASHAESLGFQTLLHPVQEVGPLCWAVEREVRVLLVWAVLECLNAFDGESRGVPQSYREVCGLLFPALGCPSGVFEFSLVLRCVAKPFSRALEHPSLSHAKVF